MLPTAIVMDGRQEVTPPGNTFIQKRLQEATAMDLAQSLKQDLAE